MAVTEKLGAGQEPQELGMLTRLRVTAGAGAVLVAVQLAAPLL